ncbi:hypothetical protein M3Y97_01063900 [Aphelenchoides bicaudatus]|nr:hypothetical protein M3Y97_01063900 [Aphelenchoides bicaudatus]
MTFYNITRFHVFVMIYWQFSKFMAAQMLFPIFSNYVPKWRCNANQSFGKNCTLYQECVGGVEFENNYFQSAALEFGWICGQSAYFTTLFSQLQFVGVIVGTLIFGSLADVFGRKPTAIVDLIIATAAFILGGLAPNWQVLFISRFFFGVSVGGLIPSITLCMELILPEQRVPMRSLCNWGTARLGLTMCCFFFPEWRHATLSFIPFSITMLLIIVFVLPESPTWLHNRGRLQKMHKTEEYIARVGKVEYVKSEVKELGDEGTILIQSYLNVWLFCGLCSSRLQFVRMETTFNSSSISGNLYWNQVLFSVFISVSKFILMYVDTKYPNFSRRMLHQSSQALSCCCFFALIALILLHETGATEGMPTKVRASATGSCSLIARFGGILAPTLGHLNMYWAPSTYVIVANIGLINLFVSYMWLVETKGVCLDTVQLDDKLLEEEARIAAHHDHHETAELLNGVEKKKSIS